MKCLQARNLLAEVLGLSPDCEPTVAETSKEAVIARELEAESFRIHGQPQSMGYKMRFRTLKLALKENVCRRRLKPSTCAFCARMAQRRI